MQKRSFLFRIRAERIKNCSFFDVETDILMLQEHIVARHDVTGGRTQTQARIHALRYWNSKSYEPVVPKCGARTIGTRKLSKSGT